VKIVLVTWKDAECQESRWTDTEEAIRDCQSPLQPCRTAGFLLYEHSGHITVTQTDGVNSVGPHITIPKGCIISVQELYAQEQS
jgi:hypothetical protein